MLHTRMSCDSGAATAAAIVPVGVEAGARVVGDLTSTRQRLAERAIDDVLSGSFPASDPPSGNPGVARPGPWVRVADDVRTIDARAGADAIGIIDVSRPDAEQPFSQALVSFAAAAAMSLTVPFVVLLAGLPFVLAIRGLLEVITWVLGIAVG